MHFKQYFEPTANSEGLVIFDRDGTLIEDFKGLSSVEMIKWLPGRISTLKKLSSLGYTIAISTNQGALEEGLITMENLLEVHRNIVDQAL